MSQQPKRTFASLRHRPPAPIASDQAEPIESRARRLFLSGADGPAVLNWLLDRANAVTPPASSDALLREAEGARRFMDGVLKAISPE